MRAAHNGHRRVRQQLAVIGIRRHPVRGCFQPLPDQRLARRTTRGHEAASCCSNRGRPDRPAADGLRRTGLVVRESMPVAQLSVATGRVVVVGSVNMDVAVGPFASPSPERRCWRSRSARQREEAPTRPSPRSAPVARIAIVGTVGTDADGTRRATDLGRDRVDLTRIRRLDDHPSRVALITIDAAENTIIVAAGANAAVTLSDADRAALGTADVVLAQLEVHSGSWPTRRQRDATAPASSSTLPPPPAEPARRAGRRPRRQRARGGRSGPAGRPRGCPAAAVAGDRSGGAGHAGRRRRSAAAS